MVPRAVQRDAVHSIATSDEAAQLQMMEGFMATMEKSLFGDVMKTEGDPADRVARIVKRFEEVIKAKMKLLPEKIKQKEKLVDELSKITTVIEEAKANGDQEEVGRLEAQVVEKQRRALHRHSDDLDMRLENALVR